MKKSIFIAGIAVLLLGAGCLVYVPSQSGSDWRGDYDRNGYGRNERDSSYFYDYLAPYGDWVDMPAYGYVWTPRHMRYGWRPYTNGRWVWTDYGWTWVSSHEWGWATFHYGRWGWDRNIGWFWVPGTEWAPAWVTWRIGDFYVGWAPLPPDIAFDDGVGFRSSRFDIPYSYWVFIEGRYFLDDDLYGYCLPYERNNTIFDFTYHRPGLGFRNGRIFNEGIDFDRAERLAKRRISRHELRDPNRPGNSRVDSRDVYLYRPSFYKNQAGRPKTVLTRDEAREKLSDDEARDANGSGLRLKDGQERERKLLEESQQAEIDSIRQKVDEDKKLVRKDEEKKKIEEEQQVKVTSLKAKHEKEKSELAERQKEEKQKVEKSKLRKKEDDR